MGIGGRRVVAVDDDRAAFEILGPALRERGAELVVAEHPGSALATVLGVMPDVVFVDVARREMEGLGLIRKLRSLPPERGGRIPAVALTAASLAEALWRAAGFQRHVAKPFTTDAVLAVVAELAGQAVERRTPALERHRWPPPPRERRMERRVEPLVLRGVAGGDSQLLRELALSDGELR
jgi:CheY-like chemotaxis protein